MQNKANFRNDKMNITLDMTSKYEILEAWRGQKTKPIQTQLKPKQTQFKANKAKNKPNSNPNKANLKQVNEKTATLAPGNYADQMLLFCYAFVYFLLLFKVPHLFGHLFGRHPSDMPVKIQHIAALLMTGPCDPSASGYVLTIRVRQMTGTKDVTSSYIPIGCIPEYGPPWPIFVVGKINGRGRTLAVRQLGCHPLHAEAIVIFTTPAVDDIANGLFLVWIARTAEYLDVAVIIVYRLLRKKGHKKLEPGLYVSPPFRRARDERIVMLRIKVGPETDLAQIIPAHYVPALLTGLPQYRHQYPH